MKKNVLLLVIIILSILLSACELDKLKFGEVRMMYGANEAGRISYDISTFTGTENGELEAEIDAVITFTYSVELNKGTLLIEWQDPQSEVVWQKEFVESEYGEDELEIRSQGIYKVFIRGEGAGGRFDLSWQEE
jgi:hypothetical protein